MVVTASWLHAYARDVTTALEGRDWATFDRLHHPDVVYVGPLYRTSGRDELRRVHQELLAAVPDFKISLVSVTVEPRENRVAVEYVQTGTLSGDFPTDHGVARGAGRSFEVPGVMVITFDDHGLVTSIRDYFDVMDASRQIVPSNRGIAAT